MRENTTQRAWNMNILQINVDVPCVSCYIEPDTRWQLGPFQPKDVQCSVPGSAWHWERHPKGSACPAPGVPAGLGTCKVELRFVPAGSNPTAVGWEVWVPQGRKDLKVLENFQRRGRRMGKGVQGKLSMRSHGMFSCRRGN